LKAVILCAGLGTRLGPISRFFAKALVPVGNRALVDWALERVRPHVSEVAVNVHAWRSAMLEHLEGRGVHISLEEARPLGTAGAVGALKDWLQGEGCLVVNADAFSADPLERLFDGWDGTSVRLLVSYQPERADFHSIWRFAGASLLPARWVTRLEPEFSGLYELCWLPELESGALEMVPTIHSFIDCGTPGELLAANLLWSNGRSVVSPESLVEGSLCQSLVLPGGRVGAGERLVRAIRLPSGETLLPFDSSQISSERQSSE
jgi:N-acetyl-alpha-D-muramate 1-phosphate uridylyltransferase